MNEPAPTPPAATPQRPGEAAVRAHDDNREQETPEQTYAIARHVFAAKAEQIDDIDYAIEYKFASYAGGDIADVYAFDNGGVAFTVADVEGHGPGAASLATLVKFSLRAYLSAGAMAESAMRQLDRLYVENCAFEKTPSFVTAFLAHIDQERSTMAYCSAGHDVAVLMRPNESPILLPVTAPLVGVFEDQRHLFKQRNMEIRPGMILVLGTDGITESRRDDGELFGSERLLSVIASHRSCSMRDLAHGIVDAALDFSGGAVRDDIAVLAAHFREKGRSAENDWRP